MAVKVLVNALGQQLLADVKQIENKETQEIVGYWLSQPRVVYYNQNDETGEVSVNFGSYCLVSKESEFSVRADHIVSILEPREEVEEAWRAAVYPEPEVVDNGDGTVTTEVTTDTPENATPTDTTEVGAAVGLTD